VMSSTALLGNPSNDLAKVATECATSYHSVSMIHLAPVQAFSKGLPSSSPPKQ
jgi:hypothetical protein